MCKLNKMIVAFAIMCASLAVAVAPTPVSANSETYCECNNTYSDGSGRTEEGASVILFGDENGCYCGGVHKIMQFGIETFTIGVVVLGTIGIIIVGLMYMTSRDSEEQVAKAKHRFLQIVIGIAAFFLFDLVISMLLPGGIASSEPTIIASTSERKERPQIDLSTPEDSKDSKKPSKSGDSDESGGSSSGGSVAQSVKDAVWNNGNECSGEKIFKATKYALTDEEIKYFSELVAIENCRGEGKSKTQKLGCRLLATQIINLYEERKHDRSGKEGCSSGGSCYYKDLKKWITHDKWYAVNHHGGMSPGKYSNSNSREAVIDVIVNGNRVMPKFVSRYDGLYHWTNDSYGSSYWGLNSISEAAKAVPMKTQVKSGGRYLWCIERKQTSNKYNGPYNEVFNYADSYRKAVGM